MKAAGTSYTDPGIILLNHLLETLNSGDRLDFIRFRNETLKLESSMDTINPVTLVTLISHWRYEELKSEVGTSLLMRSLDHPNA